MQVACQFAWREQQKSAFSHSLDLCLLKTLYCPIPTTFCTFQPTPNMSNAAKDKPLSHKLPVVDHHDDLNPAEQLLEKIKPHANLIMLGLLALFLLFIAIAWMLKSRSDLAEGEWLHLNRQIGTFERTGNLSNIKAVIEDYPEGKAGLWGLQLAGDFELRQGISKLASDKTEGLKEIEKAKNTLKKVVDAPAKQKTTMLQVRSTLSLAYAYESLGELGEAKQLYQQIVDKAPDSAFGKTASRGLERTSNPAYAVIYEKFKNWEDPFAIAPGAESDKKPDISFPDLDGNSENSNPENSNSESEPPVTENENSSSDAEAGDQTEAGSATENTREDADKF